MYTLLFWTALGLSIAVGGGALVALGRSGRMLPWDFGLVVVPGIVWFVFLVTGPLPKTLSNFAVEFIALIPVTAVLLGLRWKAPNKMAPAIFGCGIVAALLLYALVPALPE